MTTDNRTNEPSEQQVERAAEAMQAESSGFFSMEAWRHLARVALTAAGVAPQPITDEQIEAVARSLHETPNHWFVAHGSWEAAGFEIKQAFRASARTALHHMANI